VGLPVLGEMLAGDCQRVAATGIYDQCGVNFSQLSDLFMEPH
jgi:hypothetical protein